MIHVLLLKISKKINVFLFSLVEVAATVERLRNEARGVGLLPIATKVATGLTATPVADVLDLNEKEAPVHNAGDRVLVLETKAIKGVVVSK